MTLKEYHQKVDEAFDQARKEGLIDNLELTPEEQEELAKQVMDSDWFKDAMKEFEKGFQTATQWGIEAYSLDKETGKVRALTLEEALELQDNPDLEVKTIKEISPEELMKEFASHLTPEELEELSKPTLVIKDNPDWDAEKWLQFSEPGRIIYTAPEESKTIKEE